LVDRGETEAIALGLDLSCLVVIDDRKARLRARRAGLRITGILGILLRLRHLGLVARPIEDDPRVLADAGMRIAPEPRRTVLGGGANTPDDGA
jgi:predicted nucleic acid-binding protein